MKAIGMKHQPLINLIFTYLQQHIGYSNCEDGSIGKHGMNGLLSLPFGHMANQTFWSGDVRDSILNY